jgi:hypothetical protein
MLATLGEHATIVWRFATWTQPAPARIPWSPLLICRHGAAAGEH